MNVLSLFDGMGCGLTALKRADIKVDNYFASEVDKYAIQVAKKNHPEIKHIGSVEIYQFWRLPKIDLIIGGSPCQGFSKAGKLLNFSDPQSKLFFDFVGAVKLFNPDNFLLENVKMKKEYQDIISGLLGVEPVRINSNLLSAQNRDRCYWCSWEVGQPEDKMILLKDIITPNSIGVLKNRNILQVKNDKANCIDGNYYKGIDNRGQRTLVIDGAIQSSSNIVRQRSRGNNNGGFRYNKSPCMGSSSWTDNVHVFQFTHGCSKDGVRNFSKAPTVLSQFHNNYFPLSDLSCVDWFSYLPYKILRGLKIIRKFYRHELELLQTLPRGYTDSASYTQAAKMIGNGWTVDVISHILKSLSYS